MTEGDKKDSHTPADAAPALDLDTLILRKVIAKDKRYELGAYKFMYEALAFTQHMLGKDIPHSPIEERHVTGQELREGLRRLAIKEFGQLAATVFKTWGVNRTEDFGEIVFNLVEASLMAKTDSDTRADFADGYDFGRAFKTSPESG